MKKEEVQNELDKVLASAALSGASITATYLEGVVRLSGTVKDYWQKSVVEEAMKKAIGVKEIIDEIIVACWEEELQSDDSIRAEIKTAFKRHWLIPHQKISIKFTLGNATLEGIVRWKYQKDKAISVAKKIKGVRNITDKILIQSDVEDAFEKKAVEEALKNNWALDAKLIKVAVVGDTVYLTGTVCSLEQKVQAENVAWKVHGVWNVENDLVVDY